jgi:hypothetical protein
MFNRNKSIIDISASRLSLHGSPTAADYAQQQECYIWTSPPISPENIYRQVPALNNI